MEGRRPAALDPEFQPLRRGGGVGSEAFGAQILADIEEQRGQGHSGAELGESGEAKAEGLIAQALLTAGVTEPPIANWRQGHPFKVRLAARLRAESTVTVSWIAHRLAMGTRGHLAHRLDRHQRPGAGLPRPSQPSLNL